jgi:diacylglycerol kinase
MLNKTLQAIWTSLKDWKNLLAHTIVGLLILAIGLALPIRPIYRIILLVVVTVLNTTRMKFSKRIAQEKVLIDSQE